MRTRIGIRNTDHFVSSRHLYRTGIGSLVLAKFACAGVEEDWRLHLQHAAEDCQAPGGDTGPQESEPSARGQPS